MDRQLSLDNEGKDMERISYNVVLGLRSHVDHCHDIINKELILREELKKLLGLDRDSWNVLIDQAARNAGFNFADLDPYRVFRDLRHLCSTIVSHSPDPYARSIASQMVDALDETLVEDIPKLNGNARQIINEEGMIN